MGKIVNIFTLVAFLTVVNAALHMDFHLINKKVERTIDLNSQLVKITGTVTFENTGEDEATTYMLILDEDLPGNISYLAVQDSLKHPLKYENLPGEIPCLVHFRQGVQPGQTSTILFEIHLTKALTPYPTSITQKDKQLVRYFGNHYFYSVYTTRTQKTEVLVNTRAIESYSKLKPVTQTDSTITYGPYEDIGHYAVDPLTIHYENNAPFLTVTRLVRTIEVSHWGNIAIEENIELKHTGAILKGSFSRYDYQRDSSPSHHSIKSYRTILPALAHSIYYRDMNGNISTSSVKPRKDYIDLELRPRFPLFGGWQSSYILGYSIPSYPYLFKKSSGEFVLKIRLLDHVFDDMVVDELETNIVLPVGASNIKIEQPYSLTRLRNGVSYKYLDYIGRTVVRVSKKDLVEQHIQDIRVTYTWKPHMLFHEPILVSIALFIIFVLVIIYVRLDFSLGKSDHSKKD